MEINQHTSMKNRPIVKEKPNIRAAIITLGFIFGGISTGIYGINQIENYYSPYLFASIMIVIGIILGLALTPRIKPHLKLTKKQSNSMWDIKLHLSVGFIGIMLALGSLLNQGFSKIKVCDNFEIVKKSHREYRSKDPGANYLIVDIFGKEERLLCKRKYWETASVGQKINIRIYESMLGFDYIVITNE